MELVLLVVVELVLQLVELVLLLVELAVELVLLVLLVAMAVSLKAEQLAPLVADEAVDQMKALLALLQAAPRMDQHQTHPLVLLADHYQVRHLRQSQSP